jgi:uncharacterized cofD-like protein
VALIGFSLITCGILLFFNTEIIESLIELEEFLKSISVILGIILVLGGSIFVYYSLKKIIGQFSKNNRDQDKLLDVLYQEKKLERGPKVVALGGGTGLSNLLRGIKKLTSNITAVVTVADDGGSSGKLRDELGMLPPGDIRNCLVALADTEPLMEQLFQYRFSDEGHLVGHSFGNLFIASMAEVLGDFEEAIKESSKVLAIKGQVLPATNEDVRLEAIYSDGSRQLGESMIPSQGKKIEEVFLEPSSCQPPADTIEAISDSNIIVVGPGSLYTSIIPNLLVKGIADAIKNTDAVKVFVCNVMTQPGETTNYTASDHIKAIKEHVGDILFDYVIVNNEEGSDNLAKRYKEEGAFPVGVDREEIKKEQVKVVEDNLLTRKGYIRHDPERLAEVIFEIAGFE